MKRILLVLSLVFISLVVVFISINVLSHVKMTKDRYDEMHLLYADLSIENHLDSGNNIKLLYKGANLDGDATLQSDGSYYFIDFDMSITYIYNAFTGKTYHYRATLEQVGEADSLIAFIEAVETSESIHFRKLEYLAFGAYKEALEEKHTGFTYKKPYGAIKVLGGHVITIPTNKLFDLTLLKAIAEDPYFTTDLLGDKIHFSTRREHSFHFIFGTEHTSSAESISARIEIIKSIF